MLIVVIALITLLFLAVVYLIFKNGISANTSSSCPQWQPPAQDWCSDGKVVAGQTIGDCTYPPTCVKGSMTPTVTTTATSNSCPQLMPMKPGWCPNGKIETQQNNLNGCPQPPKCITNDAMSYTFNLTNGWNTITVPQFMFDSMDPISTSTFSLKGLSIYGYSNNKWETKPQFFRKNGSYLIYNSEQDRSVTVMANGQMIIGTYNGYKLNPGWNLVGNNELFSKTPSKFDFTTNVSKPGCTTPLLCDESKTISQLFAEGRIYKRIYFFNNMQSTDPNVFYTTKVLSSADLATYQIPALKAFWIYLYK